MCDGEGPKELLEGWGGSEAASLPGAGPATGHRDAPVN